MLVIKFWTAILTEPKIVKLQKSRKTQNIKNILHRLVTLVKIVVTMHNTKNYFLKMFKIYLQLRNALIKFSNIKSIVVLKLETKKLVKNGLGKNLTNLYLLSGKAHEDLL